ncbi:MAG: HAMP domain-containing histidine kinase [Bacteroidales bacterium]|jgi:two-component system phosphate regulon sensor histidine kinase PhoR|nr:HAMP domain-containing histidine kinase [Bacteroidales bacterium]
MEKRIKIIYRLTVITILGLISIQAYWLYNQYVYTLDQYEEELYQTILKTIETDRERRSESSDENMQIITQWQMKVEQGIGTNRPSYTEWSIDAYIIDKRQVTTALSLQETDSLSSLGVGVEKQTFVISDSDNRFDVHDAINRFITNRLSPFNIERFDSLLASELRLKTMTIEVLDSITWSPILIKHTSLINPTAEVRYPVDILQKEQLSIVCELRTMPILGRMLVSLVCSAILSALLLFCLLYQIRTIRKQHRIEELRKDFIKTMAHELKRPLSALKMSVSFMKNDRMMQDVAMKEEVIRNAQDELDNLSSYFSKLRDLTCGEMEKIPLNVSTFSIKELIEESIGRQNFPADREVSVNVRLDDDTATITADRMHINNVICNLLENAIKYSITDVFITANCYSVDNRYRIEVSDNGLGVAPSELPHLFEPYFRGADVTDKGILGIGLGLSYVKLLIEAHGGKIFAESKTGEGSRFIIEIPKQQ